MEEDLARSQKLESLGVLAGGIAHDFNNLLTAIIGNVSLAKMMASDPERVLKHTNLAEKASYRAQQLTQQLLTFSKGGIPIKETSVLEELIHETVAFSLRGANDACEIHLPENLWKVDLDRGQFSQVIQNLVINASQAMPEGGMITIRGENLHEPSIQPAVDINRRIACWVRIQISDQGHGIPPEVAERIFDPYYTTKATGSGLGLSTSFSIIQKHNGLLVLEPTITGATFSIYLPASAPDAEANVHDDEDQAPLQPGAGEYVLLMDDDEHIQHMGREVLKHLGYTPVCVSDGNEALETYNRMKQQGTPLACMIFDLTIPGGMGGKETIQQLRQMDEDIPVIVSSGYTSDNTIAEYRAHGFDDCISKPYRLEQLNRVLSRALHP